MLDTKFMTDEIIPKNKKNRYLHPMHGEMMKDGAFTKCKERYKRLKIISSIIKLINLWQQSVLQESGFK